MENFSDNSIGYLLSVCSKYPEIYNEVSNHLYNEFGLSGAELVLLVTYYVAKERGKERRKE